MAAHRRRDAGGGGLRLSSILLVASLLLVSIAGLQFARTHVYTSPLPQSNNAATQVPRREVLAVFKQPDALLRPCNPDPPHLTAEQQARLEREHRRDEQQGPDDFYIRPWKLPKEWQHKARKTGGVTCRRCPNCCQTDSATCPPTA